MIAAGFVGRDHCGVVLLFACKGLPVTHDVEEAEARAALVGLQSLAAIHTGQVILEMDNQSIVKEVDKKSPARSHCYGIIMNIELAMDTFAACTTVHVKRCINCLAHGLGALLVFHCFNIFFKHEHKINPV